MSKYDVIIIGGGLGGLSCGAILSKEGMNVCVLEKHRVVGGCLQSFQREGYVLDTGMHYVGSLSDGQIMRQYFKYLDVWDRLSMRKLDEDAFDVIMLEDGREYKYAMGYERFVESLASDFPHEYNGIKRYAEILQKVGGLIAPEVLKRGKISENGMEYMGMSAYRTIAECVGDKSLRNIMGGSNTLYAGNPNTTSLYEHGMICHSNIEGCYCFESGSQQLADALSHTILANGGEVRIDAGVSKIHLEGDEAKWVEIRTGERLEAANIISSLHPSVTLSLLENNTVIKKAFFTRVNSLKNSYGVFTTYLLMKPDTQPYANRNYYIYNTNDVWTVESDYNGFNIPNALMCMQAKAGSDYTDVITLLTPMPRHLYERWSDTKTGHRGEEYECYMRSYGEHVRDFVCGYFPEIRARIKKIYTASPLTYKDYTATPDGSAYGIVKDFNSPVTTHLSSRTRIRNLFMTGQSLNVHGCLGTSISSAVTCSELLGTEYLAKKIGNA